MLVDLGRTDRERQRVSLLGRVDWPPPLPACDVVPLEGDLAPIPLHEQPRRRRGREPNLKACAHLVVALFRAISIRTVTALLLVPGSAHPHRSTARLGRRVIAPAFVAGPALIRQASPSQRRAPSAVDVHALTPIKARRRRSRVRATRV